ncbi:F5/8 type C domain-containing protein [Shewanella psychrophila]|uniref:F5/8 type C domain-containing protein n=1 Tax=Shewanella psychrophila TaxID=225848 RepID=A0A1S6HMC1_9GAMM|nr:discoidin domain-containing protein [Shewanella psychrophila]AQS36638.1 F5/8 type C domain-containing protein [Shewanella psychrophila]
MVNTSDLASIDDDTSFQLDNRTVKDKLQYIYDYAANIPFDNTIISVPRADIDINVSGTYWANSIESMFDDTTADWASDNSFNPYVEFNFKAPIKQQINITFRSDTDYLTDIKITLKDKQGETLEVFEIDDGITQYEVDISNIDLVAKVRIERILSKYSYLCVEDINFVTYKTTWADVYFKDQTVDKLAELYSNPSLSKGDLAPQQAFLFALMKMLETPQALMNRFPARHRDLYYRDFLGLTAREAEPSQVAVSVLLEEEQASAVMVAKGSVLLAGQDDNGTDIEYCLEQDVLANKNHFSALYVSDNDINDMSTIAANSNANANGKFDEDDEAIKVWPTDGIELDKRYIYIGFKDLSLGDTLALFLDLNTPDKRSVQWSYLDVNRSWQSLDSSLVDNTSGLSQSGTWSAILPMDAINNGRKWIRGDNSVGLESCVVSSTWDNDYVKDRAIDGDIDTCWHSGSVDTTPSIEVTLEGPSDLNLLTVYFRNITRPGRHIDQAKLILMDEDGRVICTEIINDPEGSTEKSVTFTWPEVKNRVKTIRLERNLAWLDDGDKYLAVAGFQMVNVKGITLNGILTNASTAVLSNANQLTDTVTSQVLAPESIAALQTDIEGVSEVVQPWQSWGGKAAESTAEFNSRVANQLSHRNRAVSCADIITLAKDKFAYLYDVVLGTQTDKIQKYVLVPKAVNNEVGTLNEPALGQQKLSEVQSDLTTRGSEWANILVANPEYIIVSLVCTVDFKPDVNPVYAKAQLTKSLLQHYMPWASKQELGPRVGNQFDYYDVLACIQCHPLVDDVTALTLAKPTKSSDTESILAESGQVLVFAADYIDITIS